MDKKLEFLCKECDKYFHNKSNLRKHVRNFHGSKLNVLAPLHSKVSSHFKFTCATCDKNFNYKKHFVYHLKCHTNLDVDDEGSTSSQLQDNVQQGCKKCPMSCDYRSSTANDIINHIKQIHNVDILSEQFTFSSKQDFDAWKSKMENETNSKFVKYKYDSKLKMVTIYTCHRSGNYVSRAKGKRYLKTQGSNKIGAFCPASIKVKMDTTTSVYNVRFTPTHVGHQNDVGHLTLSLLERKELAQKIACKVPFDTILDDISIESDLKRIHLLTRKDLHNIESSFNLSSSAVRHANDAVSVESWVNELKKSDCILFYKAQGTLCKDQPFLKSEDFVLMIMTPAQSDFLIKYGSDIICIDGTHGMNAYQFEMQTILVVDNLREGFPCGFLISNRSDTEIMTLFFLKIKEHSGAISAKVFMSDLAPAPYNAWVETMGTPEKRLFCTWHIDRAWRKNLCKVKTKEKQAEVYRMLRTLLEERDATAFEAMISNFVSRPDHDIAEFVLYFQENYVENRKHWAYCYRLHAGINTNMHLERMHGVIKYIYLKGKTVKRLDKAIAAIMKFVRNKLINRLISFHKGKISGKIKDVRSRHKTMQSMSFNSIIVSRDNGWEVPSETSNEIYFIEENKTPCDCKLVCVPCNICIHRYICSCVDSSVKFNICKHIHLLCTWREKNEGNLTQAESSSARDEENDLYMHCPESSETNIIVSELSQKTIKKSLDSEKEEIMQNLKKQLDKIESPSKLLIVKKLLAPISPTLVAACSTTNNCPVLPKLPRSAPNAQINVQRRLWSTKKKSKQRRDFRKPSTSEKDLLAISLLECVVPTSE